jgi:hypothetical protein
LDEFVARHVAPAKTYRLDLQKLIDLYTKVRSAGYMADQCFNATSELDVNNNAVEDVSISSRSAAISPDPIWSRVQDVENNLAPMQPDTIMSVIQNLEVEGLDLFDTTMSDEAWMWNLNDAGWTFSKDQTIIISTFDTARKPSVWNQGTPDEPHPVDEFWPERFIIEPKDPTSGPTLSQTRLPETKNDSSKPYFTLDGTAGSWIPYGGGSRMCPGRHFAKKELIVTMAMFLTTFDIELEPRDDWSQNDAKYFMFGVMHPKGPIPARLRRRTPDV